MTSLKTLLNTVLSPNQEDRLATNVPHVLPLFYSTPIFASADELTIHKFSVRISALLKSKSPIVRWAGVYLAKATVENNWQCLKARGGTWIGILLHLLELPEAPATHEIAIRCLSSTFSLTYKKPDLTREITTPRLPTYLKQLMIMANSNGLNQGLLLVILNALNTVLRQQSTTFRPFATKYHSLLISVLSADATINDPRIIAAACKGFVSLHMAAAKGNETEEWRSGIMATINDLHFTMSRTIRMVIDEDRRDQNYEYQKSALGLEAVSDVNPMQIINRFNTLFKLLSTFLMAPTKFAVKIPIGKIVDLLERFFTITRHSTVRMGTETTASELLFFVLDDVHLQSARFLTKILIKSNSAITQSFLPHTESLIQYIEIMLSSSSNNTELELALLHLTASLLDLVKVAPSSYVSHLTTISALAFKLRQPEQGITGSPNLIPDYLTNPSAFTKPVSARTTQIISKFFTSLIKATPTLPLAIRSRIDRILITDYQNHLQALQVSAMYPGANTKYSILPMALRQLPTSEVLSSYIHPKLPPLSVEKPHLLKNVEISNEVDYEMPQQQQQQQVKSVTPVATSWLGVNSFVNSQPIEVAPEVTVSPVAPIAPVESDNMVIDDVPSIPVAVAVTDTTTLEEGLPVSSNPWASSATVTAPVAQVHQEQYQQQEEAIVVEDDDDEELVSGDELEIPTLDFGDSDEE